jgi:hypothetical protein
VERLDLLSQRAKTMEKCAVELAQLALRARCTSLCMAGAFGCADNTREHVRAATLITRQIFSLPSHILGGF